MEKYDVLVIGSGGGTKIALPAVERGLKTAFIERGSCGGTCLNRGCIPSKMLIYPAELMDLSRESRKLSLSLNGHADFSAIQSRMQREVAAISKQLSAGYLANESLDYIEGEARFTAERTVEVNGRVLTADRVFIAVGAEPSIPDIPGLAETPYMTSSDLLQRKTLPQKMVVVGGGYIAVELGYAYAAYGCEVDFLVRSRMLRGVDEDMVAEFSEHFGVRQRLHMGVTPTRVTYDGTLFQIEAEGPAGTVHFEADALLMATGVRPATDVLGLDAAGIDCRPDGHIIVDSRLRTSALNTFALGDCVGNYYFRHTVNYEGEYLVRTALDGVDEDLQYGPVPWAVFSHPQIAGVGEGEDRLRMNGRKLLIGTARYEDSTPGMARMSESGLVKVMFSAKDQRIMGVQIVGEDAANLIHYFIAMMQLGGRLEDCLETIFIHPALPEVMRDACRDAAAQLRLKENEQ